MERGTPLAHGINTRYFTAMHLGLKKQLDVELFIERTNENRQPERISSGPKY